ncbi:MAG TPA: TIGR00730 family Rossman fold protein [Flavisolibacter sp.]
MDKIKKLAIFCGSRNGNNELYARHARELAGILAQHKIELIYGGGRNGLMGIVADTVMQNDGIVRGVIPKVLSGWEHQHEGISELFVVDDMHLRKRKMYELCDGVIILPGGFGTLDELFEVLTWNVLAIHDKKVFILNSGGFYNHLLEHIKLIAAEDFLWEDLDKQITIINEPGELVSFI